MDEKILSLKPDKVKIPPGRIRRSLGNLDDLKASIQSKGQLHPIIITKENVLIAGERRLEACRELELDVLARYREDLTDADMVEIEVMENAARLDLTWIENVNAVKRLHEFKVAQHGKAKGSRAGKKGWSFADTGGLVGRKEESVRLDVRTADYLEEYPELKKLPRKSDAYKRVRDIIEDAALMELAARGMISADNGEAPQVSVEDVMDMDFLSDEEKETAIAMMESTTEETISVETAISDRYEEFAEKNGEAGVHIARRYILGDSLKVLPKLTPERFELIITDPPYGIDVNETTADEAIGVFEDSEDWMHKNMPKLFKECFRVMAPNSHMYVFFAISYYEFLIECAKKAGFDFDPLPIIWVKGKYTGKSGDPLKYPARSYEMILYLRKGSMPFVKAGMRNVIIEDPVLGTEKIHPTQKPIGVIRDLLRRSGHPGIRVLDPMAGSGAVLEACMQWGYKPVGIELDKTYHARGFDRLTEVFKRLAGPQMRGLVEDKSYEQS